MVDDGGRCADDSLRADTRECDGEALIDRDQGVRSGGRNGRRTKQALASEPQVDWIEEVAMAVEAGARGAALILPYREIAASGPGPPPDETVPRAPSRRPSF